MTHPEARFRLATVLLSSPNPLTLRELASSAELTGIFAREAAERLVESGQAVLLESQAGEPRYRWATELDAGSRQRLPALNSTVVHHFMDYVLHDYTPPQQARVLAIFQCCVGRPFYRTQSHAFMRHAVAAATGLDPYHEATTCPVHVVVLASWIGPVPYELQNVYPVTVSAGGVKQMSDTTYASARPILVDRMSAYIMRHASHYRHILTFTDGRYAQIMHDVARQTGRPIVILPDPRGPRVLRYKGGAPRTYWQRSWVQLALGIARLQGTRCQADTLRRLREMRVEAMDGV